MVTVTLDRERHLKLTLRGMLAYEEQTGISLLEGFNFKDMSLRSFTALAWACLVHEDKELTYESFIDTLDFADVPKLTEAVSQCIIESFPDKEEKAPLAGKRRRG